MGSSYLNKRDTLPMIRVQFSTNNIAGSRNVILENAFALLVIQEAGLKELTIPVFS